MSKSKEELNAPKKEVEAVNEKLQELTPEEIAQISGGSGGKGKNGCTGGTPSENVMDVAILTEAPSVC